MGLDLAVGRGVDLAVGRGLDLAGRFLGAGGLISRGLVLFGRGLLDAARGFIAAERLVGRGLDVWRFIVWGRLLLVAWQPCCCDLKAAAEFLRNSCLATGLSWEVVLMAGCTMPSFGG